MKIAAAISQPARAFALVPLAAALALSFGAASAGSVTYTLNTDFDVGTLVNVNHTTADQLQLNATGTGFPILWIANAGEDTLSEFDTTQAGASPGREVALFHTWFSSGTSSAGDGHGAWSGPAPSRTAVDIDGKGNVLNRHFDGRPPVLMKILANGFIDRNGNGVADPRPPRRCRPATRPSARRRPGPGPPGASPAPSFSPRS